MAPTSTRWPLPALSALALTACFSSTPLDLPVGSAGGGDGDSAGDGDPGDDCLQDADCDDGSFCNGSEVCVAGGCEPGQAPAVDDGIECTEDLCDEDADRVQHVPLDARCDDDDACNGVERCDVDTGCVAGAPPPLFDDVVCTEDLCDPALGATHTPLDARCDDGDPCTEGVCDPALDCQQTAVECQDFPLLLDSMPEASGESVRGAGDACGTQLLLTGGAVAVRRVAARVELVMPGSLRFLIFDHDADALVYASEPKAFEAGAGWKHSDVFEFELQDGRAYCIAAVADVGARFAYDTSAEVVDRFETLVNNPNLSNFMAPTVSSHGSADCGISIWGL